MVTATLLLLVGLPGSGKSTWCEQIRQHYPHVRVICPDLIRAALYGSDDIQGDWATIATLVEYHLCQAVDTITQQASPFAIYDATNAIVQHRYEAIVRAYDCGFITVIGIWFDFSLMTCLARNQTRSRQVPPRIIEHMDQALQQSPPRLREGFDRILRIGPSQGKSDLNERCLSGLLLSGLL